MIARTTIPRLSVVLSLTLLAGPAMAVCPTPDATKAFPDTDTCSASVWRVGTDTQSAPAPSGRCWAFADVNDDGAWSPGVDEPIAWTALWDTCERNHDSNGSTTAVTPLAGATWRCTTTRTDRRISHRIELTSVHGLVTPATAPNAEPYFPDDVDIAVTLGGDFINYSCAGWKGHDEGASLEVVAANVLLGGFEGVSATSYVYGGGAETIRFVATDSCILGGGVLGNPGGVPDYVCGGRSQVRLHDRNKCQAIVLDAPNGTVRLDGFWTLSSPNAVACIRARFIDADSPFRVLRSRCEVTVDENGITKQRFCHDVAATICDCPIGSGLPCNIAAAQAECAD